MGKREKMSDCDDLNYEYANLEESKLEESHESTECDDNSRGEEEAVYEYCEKICCFHFTKFCK